jgi:hypothetical protein
MIELNNRTILTTRGLIRCHNLLTFTILDDDDKPTGLMRIGWVDRESLRSNTTNDSLHKYIGDVKYMTKRTIAETYTMYLQRLLKYAPDNVKDEYKLIMQKPEVVELIEPQDNDPPIITKEQLAQCIINQTLPVLKKKDIYQREYVRFEKLK